MICHTDRWRILLCPCSRLQMTLLINPHCMPVELPLKLPRLPHLLLVVVGGRLAWVGLRNVATES